MHCGHPSNNQILLQMEEGAFSTSYLLRAIERISHLSRMELEEVYKEYIAVPLADRKIFVLLHAISKVITANHPEAIMELWRDINIRYVQENGFTMQGLWYMLANFFALDTNQMQRGMEGIESHSERDKKIYIMLKALILVKTREETQMGNVEDHLTDWPLEEGKQPRYLQGNGAYCLLYRLLSLRNHRPTFHNGPQLPLYLQHAHEHIHHMHHLHHHHHHHQHHHHHLEEAEYEPYDDDMSSPDTTIDEDIPPTGEINRGCVLDLPYDEVPGRTLPRACGCPDDDANGKNMPPCWIPFPPRSDGTYCSNYVIKAKTEVTLNVRVKNPEVGRGLIPEDEIIPGVYIREATEIVQNNKTVKVTIKNTTPEDQSILPFCIVLREIEEPSRQEAANSYDGESDPEYMEIMESITKNKKQPKVKTVKFEPDIHFPNMIICSKDLSSKDRWHKFLTDNYDLKTMVKITNNRKVAKVTSNKMITYLCYDRDFISKPVTIKGIFNALINLRSVLSAERYRGLLYVMEPRIKRRKTNPTIFYSLIQSVFKNTGVEPVIVKQKRSAPRSYEEMVEIVNKNHESGMEQHYGFRETYNRVNENYKWRTMRKDISMILRRCVDCKMRQEFDTLQPTRPSVALPQAPPAPEISTFLHKLPVLEEEELESKGVA